MKEFEQILKSFYDGRVEAELFQEVDASLQDTLRRVERTTRDFLVSHNYISDEEINESGDDRLAISDCARRIWDARVSHPEDVIDIAAWYLWFWEVGHGIEPYGEIHAMYLSRREGATVAVWHCLAVMFNYWVCCDSRGWLVNVLETMQPFWVHMEQPHWDESVVQALPERNLLQYVLKSLFRKGMTL